ncbi:MAG: ATPase, partial [Crenarchaeota archaeon]|nr:ATPase [Thermoproteota archaeon]
MARLVAGVDGGASSTRAVVVDPDSGGVWTGRAGPGNPVNVGAAAAAAAVRESIEDALRGTGYRLSSLASAAAGLAGLDSRVLRSQLAPHIASLSGL